MVAPKKGWKGKKDTRTVHEKRTFKTPLEQVWEILEEIAPTEKTVTKTKIEPYEDKFLKPFVADVRRRCAGLPSYRLAGLTEEERQRFLRERRKG